MLAAGVEEYGRGGGRQLWQPVLDCASAAAVGSVAAVLQTRRAPCVVRAGSMQRSRPR